MCKMCGCSQASVPVVLIFYIKKIGGLGLCCCCLGFFPALSFYLACNLWRYFCTLSAPSTFKRPLMMWVFYRGRAPSPHLPFEDSSATLLREYMSKFSSCILPQGFLDLPASCLSLPRILAILDPMSRLPGSHKFAISSADSGLTLDDPVANNRERQADGSVGSWLGNSVQSSVPLGCYCMLRKQGKIHKWHHCYVQYYVRPVP